MKSLGRKGLIRCHDEHSNIKTIFLRRTLSKAFNQAIFDSDLSSRSWCTPKILSEDLE